MKTLSFQPDTAKLGHIPPPFHGIHYDPTNHDPDPLTFVSLMDKYFELNPEADYSGLIASTFLRGAALAWFHRLPESETRQRRYWLIMRKRLIDWAFQNGRLGHSARKVSLYNKVFSFEDD